MGKKTKKEKIMADYRRKMQVLNGSQFTVHGSQYALPKEDKTSTTTVNPIYREPISDYSYVLSDLRRILFLTALAICAQVVLWYILRK